MMFSFKFYYQEACGNLRIKPCEKLLSKIEESTTETNLNLSNLKLTDDTCKAIGQALRKDVFIQTLDLSDCLLSDEGLTSLLFGLETNKFLLSLNLKGNNIRGSGAAAIGKLLRHNKHLQNLYLEWNATGILPEKFSYLCEGLCFNTSLKLLDLRNNQLNHICAQSLSDAIVKNSTLQILDIRWNSIGLIGGRKLLKSLSQNTSILKMEISANDVSMEIQNSVELIASNNAERYIKNSENMERAKLFASKLQDLEIRQDEQVKVLLEQLDKKEKDVQSNLKSSSQKISELQSTLAEKDFFIEDLSKKLTELQRKLSQMTDEKNNTVIALNETEIKHKEMKREFHQLLNKERKESEDLERKFNEDIEVMKVENSCLKLKIQELKELQEKLEYEARTLKSTINRMEESSKLEKQFFQEQTSQLNERHQEDLKELVLKRKNEISQIKEDFSENEKNLRQRITLLENQRNELKKQIFDMDALIFENKTNAEKAIEELKEKKKTDEDMLRKQMEERIKLLEQANQNKDKLLEENLQTIHEIKKRSTENDIALAEEVRHSQQLQLLVESKDVEMKAEIAKVKLEVKEQLEELEQVKTFLQDSLNENTMLQQKIEEADKCHTKEINSKVEEIKKLQNELEKQKNKAKEVLQNENERIQELQSFLASYLHTVKHAAEEFDSENKMNSNS